MEKYVANSTVHLFIGYAFAETLLLKRHLLALCTGDLYSGVASFLEAIAQSSSCGPHEPPQTPDCWGLSDFWEPLKLLGPLRLLVGPQIAGGPCASHNLHNPLLYTPLNSVMIRWLLLLVTLNVLNFEYKNETLILCSFINNV